MFATDEDCDRCRRCNSPEVRRDMACGYEPAGRERARSVILSDRLPDLTTCPVYLTTLPDVVDIAWSYAHWDKGQLALALGDLAPSSGLMDGLRILSGAIAAHSSDEMRRRQEGPR